MYVRFRIKRSATHVFKHSQEGGDEDGAIAVETAGGRRAAINELHNKTIKTHNLCTYSICTRFFSQLFPFATCGGSNDTNSICENRPTVKSFLYV